MKIKFYELSLEEKIGQLLIIRPTELNSDYLTELHIGGIFLDSQKTKNNFKKFADFFQKNSKIKLFVCTDMEGYWNPFSEFYKSENFGQIKNSKEAFELGKAHGKILREMGFNLNFSPVVELRNKVWIGRSFTGTKKEIKEKISNYIKGLHSEKIFATAKHYPGGNMIKNPHWLKYKINAAKNELEMFEVAIKNKVDFVMIGHPVICGELNSKGKPATISREIISHLRKTFNGIVITDAVTMFGLRLNYLFNFKKVYPDLLRAGNDIILDTYVFSDFKKILKRRNEILKQAKKDSELRKRIDESAKRILEKKGHEVI